MLSIRHHPLDMSWFLPTRFEGIPWTPENSVNPPRTRTTPLMEEGTPILLTEGGGRPERLGRGRQLARHLECFDWVY